MSAINAASNSFTKYTRSALRFDLVAAATVAMVAVPQAMAYAAIAGVNPVYGLYTAIIPAIVAAIFGSSNHVVTGPTNTIALATAGVLAAAAAAPNYPEFVFAIAILSGLFRLFLGTLKLGFLIRYISNSVSTGFLSGAALLIILNQVPQLLGIPAAAGHDLIGVVSHVVERLPETNFLVLGVGFGGVFLLLLARRYFPKMPAALIWVVLSGLCVYLSSWQLQGIGVIGDLGQVGFSGMHFQIPQGVFVAENYSLLLTSAGAVALLSLLEAVSVAKAIALHTGQRIDPNQEFVGQGLASIAGGFFHGIPSSGSLTRSAVNFDGGAATRAASGISGVLVFLVLLIFADWIGYIPLVSLSAIVIASALHMIDFHHIVITWRGRTISKIVIGVTFLSVLLLPLQISIYLGVGLSIIFYLIESSHLKLSYLVLNGNNKFAEKSIEEVRVTRLEVAVINVEGPLYFAAVQDLEDHISAMIDAGVSVIVLRLRRMHLIASSGISTLEFLIRRASEKGAVIRLSGVSTEVLHTLEDCGLTHELKSENIFLATEIPYESTRKAIEAQ